jgi:ribosome-binding protein aMBF1 (putative translation factor)
MSIDRREAASDFREALGSVGNIDTFERRRVARAFGGVLKHARHRQGLSQEALSEGANIDRTYPSLLERGLRTPTLPVVIEIAQALGVEPAQLVSETLERLREGEQ